MSTDVAVLAHNASLVPAGGFDTGLDDAVNLRPTNLIIVQGQTANPKNANIGEIMDDLSGVGYKKLTCVPLMVSRTRVLYPKGDLKAKPICRSSNGKVPSPFALVPQAPNCASCKQGAWKRGPGGKSIRPPCNEKIRLLVYVIELGLPRYVSFGGMSFKPASEMLEQVKSNIKKNAVIGKILNLFDYKFELSAERLQLSTGVIFAARFGVSNVEEPGMYTEMFIAADEARRAAIARGEADEDEEEMDSSIAGAAGVADTELVNA